MLLLNYVYVEKFNANIMEHENLNLLMDMIALDIFADT